VEHYIPISFLNDFIFCPYSIYFHQLYYERDTQLYHDTFQQSGKLAHKTIDTKTYSTHKNIIQGIEIYSEKYSLFGKIDIYDSNTKTLIERKKQIKKIYDGFIFQLYAQYFGMKEMGYEVEKLKLYDITHNKSYNIDLPENNPELLSKFEQLIEKIKTFNIQTDKVTLNINKCQKCIYSNICDVSLC